jgi:tetratricopeptide (TPR) repeat protein
MVSGSPDSRLQSTRLDTWKSIAQHLGRSSRTVQRWHLIYRLPVYHLSGKSGSVFAYAEELDNWLRSRSQGRTPEVAMGREVETAPSNAHHGLLYQSNIDWDSSLISSQARTRSTQFVALAGEMWKAISYRNLPGILHHYRESLDLNPFNAEAYAGLSLAFMAQSVFGLVSPIAAYASSTAALKEAVKIGSELALTRCATAWLNMLSIRDWQAARQNLEKLLIETPTCTHAMHGRGLLFIAEGYLEEASKLFLKAVQESPLSSASIVLQCWSEYLAGEFAHALHRVDEIRATGRSGPLVDGVEVLSTIQLQGREVNIDRFEALAAESPRHDLLKGALGYAYALKGKRQRAQELLDVMMNQAKGRKIDEPYAIALILIGLNEKQKAVNALELSYRNGSLWSLGFRSDPILEGLRNDPSCGRLLSKLSYPKPENMEISDQRHSAA